MLERISDVVIEGKRLLCGDDKGDPLALPEAYVNATIQQAQDALRALHGVESAMVIITVRIEPSTRMVGQ
jgi:hypothetical protein